MDEVDRFGAVRAEKRRGTTTERCDPGLAIVSGGSSGIGLACARILAAAGHPIALLARDETRLSSARDQILRAVEGAHVNILSLDVQDSDACARTVGSLEAAHGAPSWLVTSAGYAKPGLFLEQPLDEHVAHIATNYFGSLHLVRAVAPLMARAGGGRVVLVSSGVALHGVYGYSAYAPSKYAIRGLGEVLRVELRQHRIGVTVAFPPDTDTPQLAQESLTRPEATKRIAEGGGRWQADRVAAAIVSAARRGRFYVGPGIAHAGLAILGGIIGPLFRAWQCRVARVAVRQHLPRDEPEAK